MSQRRVKKKSDSISVGVPDPVPMAEFHQALQFKSDHAFAAVLDVVGFLIPLAPFLESVG